MTNKTKKYRYTIEGWSTIEVYTEAYFLAPTAYEALRMARKAGIKSPKSVNVEPVEEGTSHAL